MKTAVKLAYSSGGFPFTGYYANGHLMLQCHSIDSALLHKATFVRNNATLVTFKIVGKQLRRVPAVFLSPCLACGSFEHRTYNKNCPKEKK